MKQSWQLKPFIMKKIFVSLILVALSFIATAQTKHYDSLAVLIIDRMTDVIGDMESCSFKLNTASDVMEPSKGLVKCFTDYHVYMSGSDKMLVNAHGYKGHRQFMYNGQQLAYYSFDENNYGVLQVPDNIIRMIDSVHAMYDIEFPAVDFFYPSFTDDLLENADSVLFLGIDKINEEEYFHILATNKDITFQFWITNDAYNLPAKFAVTYKNQPGDPQYMASFSEWQVNPTLPPAMFDFLPPPGATVVRIMSKTDK